MGNFVALFENNKNNVNSYRLSKFIGMNVSNAYRTIVELFNNYKIYLVENEKSTNFIKKVNTILIYYDYETNKVINIEVYGAGRYLS